MSRDSDRMVILALSERIHLPLSVADLEALACRRPSYLQPRLDFRMSYLKVTQRLSLNSLLLTSFV